MDEDSLFMKDLCSEFVVQSDVTTNDGEVSVPRMQQSSMLHRKGKRKTRGDLNVAKRPRAQVSDVSRVALKCCCPGTYAKKFPVLSIWTEIRSGIR